MCDTIFQEHTAEQTFPSIYLNYHLEERYNTEEQLEQMRCIDYRSTHVHRTNGRYFDSPFAYLAIPCEDYLLFSESKLNRNSIYNVWRNNIDAYVFLNTIIGADNTMQQAAVITYTGIYNSLRYCIFSDANIRLQALHIMESIQELHLPIYSPGPPTCFRASNYPTPDLAYYARVCACTIGCMDDLFDYTSRLFTEFCSISIVISFVNSDFPPRGQFPRPK